MKSILSISLILYCSICLQAQTFTDKKGDTHLWGKTNLEALKGKNYLEWFDKNSAEHQAKPNAEVAKSLQNVKVKIFLGTWCGDTKYLLPRFVKSWKAMQLPEDQLEFIAVHYEGEKYKQGPNHETMNLNIHRVPTFIFEKDGKEIGRIVERTVYDIDTDIKCIAQGLPYKPRYMAVKIINDVFQDTPLDSLQSENFENDISKKVRRETSSAFELNTYAWVLFTEGKKEEAEFVFKLNAKLFKHEPYIRESYARCLMKKEKWEEAKEEYLESLRIEPDNKGAIKRLHEIYEAMAKVD